MSRLPIRLRLTLAFAFAMGAVLAATGAFLYLRLASSLDETIAEGLEARAADVAALVARGDSGPARRGLGTEESGAQVIDPSGRIVYATPRLSGRPLLDGDERDRVKRQGSLSVELGDVPGVEGTARLLAKPVDTPSGTLVLIVVASQGERDEALSGFLRELLLIGPAALLLASALGYALATAAFRPVESMRAEAAGISGAEPGRRLPLPRTRDETFRLGETLNVMLDRLESTLERERAFVGNASHELRTPLALLKTELELALRRPRSHEELEEALRSAAAETDRLARLAEDLLVLARSDQGRLPLRREAVPADDLLRDVAERFGPEAEKAGRTIQVIAPDGLQVVGDEVRLTQALGNLVDNALRHGRGLVQLSAMESNGLVELHVVDEGAGFPPEFLGQAFERFSRADQARSGDGAGLGLAIVAVIAGAHSGSAHAANRDGRGADVWLSLPER